MTASLHQDSNRLAASLRALREATGLSLEALAGQVGAEVASLRDAEAGTRTPTVAVIARCAMLAGLEPDEFLRGASIETAPVALLRTAAEAGPQAVRALREDRVALLCGELFHRARVVQQVERACGMARANLPVLARGAESLHAHPAEESARRAREALGLDDGPIRSMRALLEQHGVLIVWTAEDEVPETIDGISLVQPTATVLANLRHGRERYWHTRMTLAHELGHLLLDHLRRGVAVMHSPSTHAKAAWLEGYDDLERDANAFAACFLAPASAVRRCVGGHDPDSEQAIVAVGAQLGVGRTVAINRLQHVFGLSSETRTEMECRPARHYDALGRDDIPREDEVGLRRGVFRQRVVEALSRSLISRARAGSLLGLSPDEPLVEAPTAALRAPLRPLEHLVLERARRALEASPFAALLDGWSPVAATRLEDESWRIQLLPGAGVADREGVFVRVSEAGDLLDAEDFSARLRADGGAAGSARNAL